MFHNLNLLLTHSSPDLSVAYALRVLARKIGILHLWHDLIPRRFLLLRFFRFCIFVSFLILLVLVLSSKNSRHFGRYLTLVVDFDWRLILRRILAFLIGLLFYLRIPHFYILASRLILHPSFFDLMSLHDQFFKREFPIEMIIFLIILVLDLLRLVFCILLCFLFIRIVKAQIGSQWVFLYHWLVHGLDTSAWTKIRAIFYKSI